MPWSAMFEDIEIVLELRWIESTTLENIDKHLILMHSLCTRSDFESPENEVITL